MSMKKNTDKGEFFIFRAVNQFTNVTEYIMESQDTMIN